MSYKLPGEATGVRTIVGIARIVRASRTKGKLREGREKGRRRPRRR